MAFTGNCVFIPGSDSQSSHSYCRLDVERIKHEHCRLTKSCQFWNRGKVEAVRSLCLWWGVGKIRDKTSWVIDIHSSVSDLRLYHR